MMWPGCIHRRKKKTKTKKPPKALGKRHEKGENKHDLPGQDAGSAFFLHAVKLFAKGNNFTPLPLWNYSISADSPSGAQLQISKDISGSSSQFQRDV